MRRERLSDETIDGMLSGMRLASNPKVLAARDAFWKRVAEDKAKLAHLDADALIAALKTFNPAYIVGLLRKRELLDLRDKVVMSMQGRDREQMLDILGLEDWRTGAANDVRP